MVHGCMTRLLRNMNNLIKNFYLGLLNANEDAFTMKELFTGIKVQCWVVLIMTIFFNVDLWYQLLVLDENTSVSLIVLNVLMYILWMFIELQYYSLKQIEKETK